MSAGITGSISYSALHNGSIIVRDVTHGIVAGAIAVGASSLYIIRPIYALIPGFVGGLIQALIQNVIEKNVITRGVIISTVSWSLFVVQSLIGAGFATGWKKIANTKNSSSFQSTVRANFGEQYEMYAYLVSLAVGLVAGIVAGLFGLCTNVQGRN